MNPAVGVVALVVVSVATAVIGFYGLRISRTTGDFYVASRTVRPWWNASAIGGEYLSAASFLGVAGLILLSGTDALWFPVGYTAGYLMLLLFVAAPLRRSGAYTIPDFTEARLDSRAVRRVTSLVVVVVGWLYIVPQLHGAALTIRITTGLPPWVGSAAVVIVVCLTVVAGGMRSITFVQAFQYWLKLTALAVPVLFIVFTLAGNGTAAVAPAAVNPTAMPPAGAYQNVSLLVALLFGTLGLPHVLVRFYTNPDGSSARRTTLIVLGLLSVFYLFPTAYGLAARMFAPELARSGQADAVVLLLPGQLIGGTGGFAGRRYQPGRAWRRHPRFSARGCCFRHRPAGLRLNHRFHGPRRQRGARVRVHRIHGLPGPPAGHLVARTYGHRRYRRNGDRCRPLWRRHGVRGRPGRRDPVLACPAGGVDRAGRVRRDGVRLTPDKRPDSQDHDTGHDAASHAGTATGHRTLSGTGNLSVNSCHEFHYAVQEGINLGFLVTVLARRGAEDGPADAVDAEWLVLLEVADQVMAKIVYIQDVVAADFLLRGAPEAFPVRPVQAAPKDA